MVSYLPSWKASTAAFEAPVGRLRLATSESGKCSVSPTVICHAGHANVGRSAGNGDDMALVVGDHIRKERLHRVPVAQHVDVEDLAKLLGRRIQNCVRSGNAGIVDEDGGRAQRCFDALSGTGYGARIRNIAGKELDIRIWDFRQPCRAHPG